MPENLICLLKDYRKVIWEILGDRLCNFILYGSCARGDFRRDSDVDIMILADVYPEEVSNFADKVYDVTYDFEMEHELEINPSLQSVEVFEKWKNTYPFFMNIAKDGIEI